jgi:hypothetical protein
MTNHDDEATHGPGRLVRCSDGRLYPPAYVCIHLWEGQSDEWIAYRQIAFEGHDYVCVDCDRVGTTIDDSEDLRRCSHCIGEIIARRGVSPVYTPDLPSYF